MRSSGMLARPRQRRSSTVSGKMLSSAMMMSPLAADAQARRSPRALGLPVALDADQPDDLAGMDVEVEAVDQSVPRALTTRRPSTATVRSARVGLRSTRSVTSRPTIMVARSFSVTSLVCHLGRRSCLPHHRDAVGDLQHFGQLVGDEDHRAPLLDQRADRRRTARHFLRREHGGRLVEDQDARIAVERLEDLDALLLADRQLADRRQRIDMEPEFLGERADVGDRLVAVEADAGPRLGAEHDILVDGEGRDQREMLEHHADAGVDRLARIGKTTGLPSSRSSPRSGCSMPNRIFISVDLPAPFSPTTA